MVCARLLAAASLALRVSAGGGGSGAGDSYGSSEPPRRCGGGISAPTPAWDGPSSPPRPSWTGAGRRGRRKELPPHPLQTHPQRDSSPSPAAAGGAGTMLTP